MGRFKLAIEYDGTRYSGWQVQRNARTVQGELMRAVEMATGESHFELYGSGRTDAGVHAIAQVAHLEVRTQLAPHILAMKMNDNLPADICIFDADRAAPSFHARHSAIARSYIYHISRRRTAFNKRFVWWVKDQLHTDRMRESIAVLPGMNDFRSFTGDDPEEKSTLAKIDVASIEEFGDLIVFRIVGSHFLWKMVRRLVGVMVEVGRGSLPPSEFEALLTGDSDLPARYTAPPSGLFLERIYYPGDTVGTEIYPAVMV
jgi:tRNA pseudouridine38-40 synthase